MADSPLRLVLFDCDGTLVDSQTAIVAAMTAAFRSLGLADPDPQAVRRIVGLPLPEAVMRILPDAAPDTLLLLAERYRNAFRTSRLRGELEEPLFPGMAKVIDTLEASGCLLGVATGKSHRGLLATLERHGLSDRFVTLQTADSCPGKPNPDMVLRAMSQTGVEAKRTVVIGDTTYDMEMARSAGVAAIGVGWGYHDAAELTAAGAELVCAVCEEVPPAIFRLLEGLPEESGMLV